MKDRSAILNNLSDLLRRSDWEAARSAILDIKTAGLCREAMLMVKGLDKPHPAIRDGFHSMWTAEGHRIRVAVADDAVLLDALHVLLPPYGGAALTLYRGESVARWLSGAVGNAWTERRDVAEMFARGLNAVEPNGGVLLSTDAPSLSIITGPSRHSVYLGEYEYVVDTRQLLEIVPLATYPPLKGNV